MRKTTIRSGIDPRHYARPPAVRVGASRCGPRLGLSVRAELHASGCHQIKGSPAHPIPARRRAQGAPCVPLPQGGGDPRDGSRGSLTGPRRHVQLPAVIDAEPRRRAIGDCGTHRRVPLLPPRPRPVPHGVEVITPFVWRKTAEHIVAKVKRGRAARCFGQLRDARSSRPAPLHTAQPLARGCSYGALIGHRREPRDVRRYDLESKGAFSRADEPDDGHVGQTGGFAG